MHGCIFTLAEAGSAGPQSLALALGIGALVALASARLKLPAILPLLVVGMVLGDSGLHVIDGRSLESGLKALITVSIGWLIFEGSLHLDKHTLGAAPKAVWRLLTLGAAVTWLLTTILGIAVLGLPIKVALVLGAILLVTGPTVIQPVIRRIPLTRSLSAALSAEAIIIDAIGAVVAVTTLEAVVRLTGDPTQKGAYDSGVEVATHIVFRLLVGGAIGAAAGWCVARIFRRVGQLADHAMSLLAAGACMAAVGLSEFVAYEAGLAAATTCGLVIAQAKIQGASELRRFTEHVSVFLLATMFVLLASRLEVMSLLNVGWPGVIFVAGLLLVVRPASVLGATVGTSLSRGERFFASLFAPRGIVAASVASFAGIQLTDAGFKSAEIIEPIVAVVIITTVVCATFLTKPLAKALGVLVGEPPAVLIVGAHRLGRELALALVREGADARIIDTNAERIADAREAGLKAYLGDATDPRWLEEEADAGDYGWVVACTGNSSVDAVVARWAASRLAALAGGGANRALMLIEPGDRPVALHGVEAAISKQRSLYGLLWDLERGAATVTSWTGPRAGALPFAKVTPASPSKNASDKAPKAPARVTILSTAEKSENADPETRTVGIAYNGPVPEGTNERT